MFKTMTKATAHLVEIAIILGVLILLNILAEDVHARVDLTADKQYTLSQESKDVVSNLKDELILTLYTSPELPTLGRRIIKETKDLINEYEGYANSNFVVREEHPDVNDQEEVQRLAQSRGIYPVEVRDYEASRTEKARVYIALLVSYGDKHEAIMALNDFAGLEYKITRAILKMTLPEMPVIGVYAGAGVDPLAEQGGFYGLGQSLRSQYEVQNVDLSRGPVNDKVETLVVIGPSTMSSSEKIALDQYIMRGGKVVFFVDAVDIQLEQGLQGRKRKHPMPLADILGHYGFKVSPELVLDSKFNKGIPLRGYLFPPPYPLWPKVLPGQFGDLAFTSKLEAVTLPWVSPVEYTGDTTSAEGRTVDYIFRSSPESFLMKEPFDLNPGVFLDQSYRFPGEPSEENMGVMVKGIFTSYYAGKEIPTTVNPDGVPEPAWSGEIVEQSIPTEIVVIGSSSFASDIAVDPDGQSENALFILNMMDSMNLGGGLSGLRSRKVTDRPLKEFDDEGEKAFMKFAGIWLIPILLSLFGAGRYILRTQTRKMIEAKTAGIN